MRKKFNFVKNNKMDSEPNIAKLVSLYENYRIKRNYLDVADFQAVASYYLKKGELKKALEVILTAKEIYPTAEELLITESQILIELGYYRAAERRLRYLMISYPDDLRVSSLLGITLAKLGIVYEATEIFDSLLEQIPEPQKPVFLYEIAQTFIKIGRFDIAQQYLSQAYNLDSKNLKVILDLAYCYDKNNEPEKSIEFYNKYLKYNPFSKLAWHNIGLVYNKQGQFKKAIEAFDFALAIDPDFVPTLFNKAMLLYETHKYYHALELFSKILEKEPENITVQYFISQIYLKKRLYNKALSFLKEMIKKEPNFADVWYSLSRLFFAIKKYDISRKFLKKALSIDNTNYKYWALAQNLYGSLDLRRINRIFRKIINNNPYNSEYWQEHTKLLIKNGEIDQAIKLLRTALIYIKDDFNLFYYLGYLFIKKNQKDKAIWYFKKALQINPDILGKIRNICPSL